MENDAIVLNPTGNNTGTSMTETQANGHEHEPTRPGGALAAEPAASGSPEPADESWKKVEREENERSEQLAGASLGLGCLAWLFLFYGGSCAFSAVLDTSSDVVGALLAVVGLVTIIGTAIYGLLMGVRCLTAEGRQGRGKAIVGILLNAVLLLGLACVVWIWILEQIL